MFVHFDLGYFAENDITTLDASNICWRIVNKEGEVFRKPQEGWGTNRVYIPVTAPKGNKWIYYKSIICTNYKCVM